MNFTSLAGLVMCGVGWLLVFPEKSFYTFFIMGAGLFVLGLVSMFHKIGKGVALALAMYVDAYRERTNAMG
jgi:hypothetical protein